MTTPVVMEGDEGKDGGNYETMEFILPKQYTTVESAPAPTNPAVEIFLVPPKYVASRTFSGKANHQDCVDEYNKLKPEVEKEGYKITGKWEVKFHQI